MYFNFGSRYGQVRANTDVMDANSYMMMHYETPDQYQRSAWTTHICTHARTRKRTDTHIICKYMHTQYNYNTVSWLVQEPMSFATNILSKIFEVSRF